MAVDGERRGRTSDEAKRNWYAQQRSKRFSRWLMGTTVHHKTMKG